MSINVRVNLSNPAAVLGQYGAGAKVRLESSATEAGTYAEVASSPQAIVASSPQYAFPDALGTATTWYRSRVSTASPAAGGDYSAYSAPFQVGYLTAYADEDDLLAMLPDTPTAAKYGLLTQCLQRASAVITARCGRDFYRHPQVSGTEARLYDIRVPSNRLIVVDGIVSLTSAEYASYTGGTFATVSTTDWFLRPTQPEPEDSYYEVLLSDQGSVPVFYRGTGVVRLTGVFGYASVPSIIAAGCLALAREMYALMPSGRGSASGAAGFGSIAVPDYLPRPTYEAIEWGRRRTRAWV